VAVAAHGYPRPSKDLDIVPSPRPENPKTTPAEKTAAASDLAQTPKKSSDKQ
jgi:hypothetical protein